MNIDDKSRGPSDAHEISYAPFLKVVSESDVLIGDMTRFAIMEPVLRCCGTRSVDRFPR
jgi:hypothetical protein